MPPRRITRRELAQAAAGTAILASTGVLVHESGGVLLGVLARFRNDVLAAFRASELETLATVAHDLAAKRGLETMEAVAAAVVGQDSAAVQSLSEHELHSIIGRNVRADFERNDVVDVGGWQMARTEVLIVALTVRKPVGCDAQA